MATNGGVSFRKIDSSKLSFFDLPSEVRELVYQEHFFSLGDFNIHLTNVVPDRPPPTRPVGSFEPIMPFYSKYRRAVISTQYAVQLESRQERSEAQKALKERVVTVEQLTADVARLDLDQSTFEDTIEDLIAGAPQTNIMWTNLEAAAKILKTEASSYSYCGNLFRVVGSSAGEGDVMGIPYHSDLEVVPQLFLSRIKNLELDHGMWDYSNKVGAETWMTGTWPILLTRLVNLQNLWLIRGHPDALCNDLNLFTMSKACYVGLRPTIRVEVEVEIVDDELRQPQDPYHCVRVSPYAPRFLIPPLKTITLRGWLDKFDSCDSSLDAVDWNGLRLKRVKTYKTFIYEIRVYELVWS